jgi:hypothetical protein
MWRWIRAAVESCTVRHIAFEINLGRPNGYYIAGWEGVQRNGTIGDGSHGQGSLTVGRSSQTGRSFFFTARPGTAVVG